jgi:hypothetical protein
MRRLLCLVVLGASVLGIGAAHASPPDPGNPAGRMLGAVLPLNAAYKASGAGNLVYHGGPVEHTNRVYSIYWQPSGFTMASGYTSLVDQFFGDVAADSGKSTNVYYTGTQYSDGSGNVQYSSSYGGSVIDTDPLPASGCSDSYTSVCVTDAQIQNEIRAVVARRDGRPVPRPSSSCSPRTASAAASDRAVRSRTTARTTAGRAAARASCCTPTCRTPTPFRRRATPATTRMGTMPTRRST